MRTIPTQVGKTLPASNLPLHHTDHPHAGGENHIIYSQPSYTRGPSPRRWGKRMQVMVKKWRGRTIPTQVGKTVLRGDSIIKFADHPHAGGENCLSTSHIQTYYGPSPRRWGKHGDVILHYNRHRTIPTQVGKTEVVDVDPDEVRDHPHAGGENSLTKPCRNNPAGPSPRRWGKRLVVHPENLKSRTIPTQVGKTHLLC